MRVWWVLLLLVPVAGAEFGAEEGGWPVGVDGTSHHPAERFDADALATLQREAWDALPLDVRIGLHDAPLGPLNRQGPATIYPYYPIVVAEVQRLANLHPDIVRLHEAGTSEAGLTLWMLEIGDFTRDTEPDFVPWADRESIWIDGGTHSNEYSGVYFVLAVAQYLIESYGQDDLATFVVENRHTWIMPMVNPDGSHLMGRLNANLVNINRNYPVIWGGEGTDDLLNNPGPEPASEVETRVNIDWFERVQPDYYASIHCCGNLWLFPYGEDGYDPPDVDMMNRVCDEAFPPEIREDCGPIWSTIYPASGSSVDTAYEHTGGVSFGFEMSGRSNLAGPWGEPVTFEEVFAQEAESWQGIRHALEHVERYGGHPVIDAIRSDDRGLHVTVRNDGLGPLEAGFLTYHEAGLTFGKAPLPVLAPEETVTVFVDGSDRVATMELRLDYQQRRMTEPWHHERTPVQVVASADAVVRDGDGFIVPLNPLAEPPAPVSLGSPGVGWLAVVGVLALALRRR